MGAQKGKDLLLKMHDGTSFATVAGLRSRRIAFNAETVDVTHAESTERWRELLAGAGIKRASVSGRGLFRDTASDALVRQAFFDGALKLCQVLVPDFGIIEGLFQISSLEFSGEHNGEVTFDLSLESAGALTFTAGQRHCEEHLRRSNPFFRNPKMDCFASLAMTGIEERKMPNIYRGEISADIGGRRRTLVLTLGALAELESAFGANDLMALAERFGTGRLSSRDLTKIIAAGLRGAGEAVSDDEVAAMTVDGGAAGYVRIAADLIAATFDDAPIGEAR